MPMPYAQTKPEYPVVVTKNSQEVPVVLSELFKVYNPQVANLPVDLTTVTYRENEDGSKKRLEASYEHNVFCLTYQFNTGAEGLEILDLKEGVGQRTTLDANGDYSHVVGGMVRTRYGTEFQGNKVNDQADADKAAAELAKFRQVIAVAEQHIR